jgi:probable HAF family extracellular repeat protein
MEGLPMTVSRFESGFAVALTTAFLVSCGGTTQLAPTTTRAARSLPNLHRPSPGYTFYDLGTLGGPQSDMQGDSPILNNRNQAFGWADTAAPNPYYPNFNPFHPPDQYLFHGFVWNGGGLTDLGALPGTNDSVVGQAGPTGGATGASENGLIDPILGWPEAHAVMWSGGQIVDLGTLGGYESNAGEMNARGQVTGAAANAILDQYSLFGWGTQTRGFIWEKASGMLDIGTLGGPDTVSPFINQRGQISGCSYTNSTPNSSTGLPTLDPFLWYDNKMTDLGGLGGVSGCANGLNESGEVAGTSDLAGDQTFHPFLWAHGRLIDVGTLGGDYGSGNGINNAGQVAGWAFTKGNNAFHAFRWKNGVMTDLGTVDGDQCSNANGINARGDVVGASSSCGYGARAYLSHNGTMIDLNEYVPPSSSLHLVEALYINDNGAIAGHGVLPNGDFHAFVLIPSGRLNLKAVGHDSYRSTATADHVPLREMLRLLLAREARMKHMPFLIREMKYLTGRGPR